MTPNLEKLCVSLETAITLKKVGILFEGSLFVWSKYKRTGEPGDLIFNNFWELESRRLPNDKYAYQFEILPAPMLGKIMAILPPAWTIRKRHNGNVICDICAEYFKPLRDKDLSIEADTPQDAAAAMVIKLKEGEG